MVPEPKTYSVQEYYSCPVFSPSSLLVSLGGSPRSMENLTILGVIEDILLLKQ